MPDKVLEAPHRNFEALCEYIQANLEAAGGCVVEQGAVLRALGPPDLDGPVTILFRLDVGSHRRLESAVQEIALRIMEIAVYGEGHPSFEEWRTMVEGAFGGSIQSALARAGVARREHPEA